MLVIYAMEKDDIVTQISQSDYRVVEDPLGREIIINENDEHPVRDDGRHARDYDEIEEVLEDPDEIWETDDPKQDMYLKETEQGRWVVVRVYKGNLIWYTVSTARRFSTLEDARELIEDGWGPSDRIYP